MGDGRPYKQQRLSRMVPPKRDTGRKKGTIEEEPALANGKSPPISPLAILEGLRRNLEERDPASSVGVAWVLQQLRGLEVGKEKRGRPANR